MKLSPITHPAPSPEAVARVRSALPPVEYGDSRLFRTMSTENMLRLFTALISPDRVLTPATSRLADHVMANL